MYHDTMHINFKSQGGLLLKFDYSFLISKNISDKFSPIKYNELLQKFVDIGFDLKYLKFNDIDDDAIVYCTYNYQPNFNIFFTAYKKTIYHQKFNITLEYGVMLNGKFYPNNMNFFARIWFVESNIPGNYLETIVKGKTHEKRMEFYQIIDKNGNIIATETTSDVRNFEQNFFQQYDVKVALRKYKLSRLQPSD
jgi:hypothetical protein